MASDTVTARQAADMTGHSERTIRRMIKAGKLKARHVAPNRYEIAVEDLPRKKRDPLADLRAQVEALERRVRTLEALNAHQTRQDDRQAAWEGVGASLPSYAPVSHYSALHIASSSDGVWLSQRNGQPSANARGKWVEGHGGPGRSFVREWADVREWRGPEDAIAAVRRHYHWRDWQPRECADPSCLCHERLGSITQ